MKKIVFVLVVLAVVVAGCTIKPVTAQALKQVSPLQPPSAALAEVAPVNEIVGDAGQVALYKMNLGLIVSRGELLMKEQELLGAADKLRSDTFTIADVENVQRLVDEIAAIKAKQATFVERYKAVAKLLGVPGDDYGQ